MADINGDGRADYLEVTRSGSGAVNEWLNGGGPNDGPNAILRDKSQQAMEQAVQMSCLLVG